MVATKMQSKANQYVAIENRLLPDMEGVVFDIGTVWDTKHYKQ